MSRFFVVAAFLLSATLLAGSQEVGKPAPYVWAIDSWVRSAPGYKAENLGPILDDSEFLKRLTRDLIDAAPTAAELMEFAANKDPKKREVRIGQLTESDKFAEFWAKRLAQVFFDSEGDLPADPAPVLGSEQRGRIQKAFVDWLRVQLAKDRPYTEIVFGMIDARGSVAENPALGYKLSFYRGAKHEEGFAIGMSRQLLGVRIHCARCHDHPYDRWTFDNFYGLAAFETRAVLRGADDPAGSADKIRVLYSDSGESAIPDRRSTGSKIASVNLADGGVAKPRWIYGGECGKNDDRMKVLASYLTDKRNPQLPRALANRVWGWLLGRAVVHPADGFNMRNKPLSSALIDGLSRGFQESGYSLKSLVRAICAAEIYQRGDVPPAAEGDEVYWRGAIVRPAPSKIKWPPPSLKLDLPPDWIRTSPTVDAKAQYRVPDPNKKARDAQLAVFGASTVDRFLAQMAASSKKSDPIEGGKGRITLHDITGTFVCDQTAEVLGSDRMLVGVVVLGTETVCFRLVGPAETVDARREEFLALLKGAQK